LRIPLVSPLLLLLGLALLASACAGRAGGVRPAGELPATRAELATAAATHPEVEPLVADAAARHGVAEELVLAVIWNESRFRPTATSPAGAMGLMQLMPSTVRTLSERLGVADPDPYDPAFNVDAGTYYLGLLLRRFAGDETLALAAYAAGPGAVQRWQRQGRRLPASCQRYAARVLAARDLFRQGERPSLVEPVPPTVRLPEPEDDGRLLEQLILAAEQRDAQRAALQQPASPPSADEAPTLRPD